MTTPTFDPQTVVDSISRGDTVDRNLLAGALGHLGQQAVNDDSPETLMDLELAVAALSGNASLVLEVLARQMRNAQAQPAQNATPDPLAGLAGMAPQPAPQPAPAPQPPAANPTTTAQQPATPANMPGARQGRASRAAEPR